MMELRIKNISKTYGKSKKALCNVDISLTPGIYGLLGPNGSGKSTLMNIITDNLKADRGCVYYDGDPISKLGSKYREKIGYMPQQQEIYDNFTGEEFLWYMAALKGLEKKYAKNKIDNLLKVVMRMLRSISHQAAEQGIPFTHSIDDLFAYVFTGYEPTAKRAISPLLIRRLVNLDLEKKPALRFSRDMFLLSFYLRGIPFVDLVHLRKTDVKHNTIYYYRHKTRQQLSVHIESYAAQIINRYKNEAASSPYLLPILSLTGEDGYRQYKSALRLYNQHLHTLSKMLRLSIPLTSYVARHKWV